MKPNEVPFRFFEKDYLVVRVKINGSLEKDFILDTGIGVTMISKSLCAEIRCEEKGSHTGKRMSGQAVTVPLSHLPSIALGAKERKNFPVGIFDIDQILPKSGISGFLSLGFFQDFPHTVDYTRNVIRYESEASLAALRASGIAVKLTPDQDGPSYGVMMPLVLPHGQEAKVEVDTGSQSLILHEKYMKPLGISPNGPEVKRRDGKDETGHTYARFFTSLNGPVHLPGAKSMKMENPAVMFQKIIYDGLVGYYFLREFTVTYDLPKAEIIFNRPGIAP